MRFGLWPYLAEGTFDEEYYNCSGKTNDEWFARGLRRPILAVYLETAGTFFMIFYVLSLIGMYRARLMTRSPCYIIMVFMGIGDLVMIMMSSGISGYLFWRGAVFCNYPRLIYVTGCLGLGMWSSSCCCCIMLAMNRLAEIADWKQITEFLTKRTCVMICVLGLAYGMWLTFCTPAPLFNSSLGAWFFNPFTDSQLYYDNIPHRVNNAIVSIFAIYIYGFMCYKVAKSWGWAEGMSKAQRMLYIQAFIICSTHVLAAWGYLLMNYLPGFPQSLIVLGHVAWQWSHGVPGVVYLALNPTIKRAVLVMFGVRRKTRPGGTFTVSRDYEHTVGHTERSEKSEKNVK